MTYTRQRETGNADARAPMAVINQFPGSGLQHGRNNITVRGPLQQTISRWFRVRCVRDVTKLACRSMVEVNLLL